MDHKKVELVRDLSDSKTGVSRKLWKVSPPVKYRGWNFEKDESVSGATEYVITSAVDVPFTGPETYIFPADEDGNILSWGELPGSYRGGYDHEYAISELRDDDDW